MRSEIRPQFLLFNLLGLALLAACGPATPLPAPYLPPLNPGQAAAHPYPYPQPPQIPSVQFLEPYPYPAEIEPPLPRTPTPDLAPPIAPVSAAWVAGMLANLQLEPLAENRGLTLSGWQFGLRPSGYCLSGPFRWLDEDHLVAFLVYGSEKVVGRAVFSVPAVLSLPTRSVWFPLDPAQERFVEVLNNRNPFSACPNEPAWSASAGKLVYTNPATLSINIYEPDGTRLDSFFGAGQPNISPSGEWLFVASVMDNLINGDRTTLTLEADVPGMPVRVAWNPDESRIFGCCHYYTDREAAVIRELTPPGLWPLDMIEFPGQLGPRPFWTADGEHVMYYGAFRQELPAGGFTYGPLPLLNPATGAYEDLRILAGLAEDDPCELVAAAPDGRAALAKCGSGWQLLDLDNYTALRQNVDGDFQVLPAPNNAYFLLAAESPVSSWLAAADGSRLVELGPLPAAPAWHPQESWLAYPSADGGGLEVYRAETLARQTLPVGRGRFSVAAAPLRWDAAGRGLFFQTQDGRVGYLPDLDGGTTYLLTPPYPELRDLQVSPEGGWIAFVQGNELYVFPVPRG